MVNISLVILDGCVSVASFPDYVISSPPPQWPSNTASVSREVTHVPWSNLSGAHVKIGTGGIADQQCCDMESGSK